MTALDDRPTRAEAQRAETPTPTGRLVVLDLDDPRVADALDQAIGSIYTDTVLGALEDVAEPVAQQDDEDRGHRDPDGAWVGHHRPIYAGAWQEA